jgi:hypothetical protein
MKYNNVLEWILKHEDIINHESSDLYSYWDNTLI